MKSNRMRNYTHALGVRKGALGEWLPISSGEAVDLEKIGAPLPIEKPEPEKIVWDIVAATLQRVQDSSSEEIAEAAARFLKRLRAAS